MAGPYLLDTSICIELIRGRSPRAVHRLARHAVTDVWISAITVGELEYGVAKSRFASVDRDRLDQFLAPLQVMAFDDRAAESYGEVRAALERRGQGIGPLDTLLAAQAVSRDCVMVTSNRAEFARVPKLRIEDWTRA